MSRMWLLLRGEMGEVHLGPIVRAIELARAAQRAGLEPILCLDQISDINLGFELRNLRDCKLSEIAPNDRVLVSPHLPWPILWPLLRSNIRFDVDMNGIGALEGMESGQDQPAWKLWQGRRRTAIRYRLLIQTADKLLLSTHYQTCFLGGMLFRESNKRSIRFASTLNSRIILAPMGISTHSITKSTTNPYPKTIQDRPIFLWGGGIWSWMDIPTLLNAFKILRERGESPCLFFLTRSNPSMVRSQDSPAQIAWKLAQELEIEGINVFFNENKATPNDLPGYLKHCRSGILSNPERLESIGSWRTRILDLLWAGRPAVVSGWDPLAQTMSDSSCAYLVNSGDSYALADAISRMASANTLDYEKMCQDSFNIGQKYLWEKNLLEYQKWLSTDRTTFNRHKAPFFTMTRSLIGY